MRRNEKEGYDPDKSSMCNLKTPYQLLILL